MSDFMNYRKILLCLKNADGRDTITFEKVIFDNNFSLQAILEQYAVKQRKPTGSNLFEAFSIHDHSKSSEGQRGLSNIHVTKKLYFKACKFTIDADFSSSIFDQDIYISDCEFLNELILSNSQFNEMVDIQRCKFGTQLILTHATFFSAFNLSSSKINDLFAKNVVFNGVSTIRGVDISRIIIFAKSVFHKFTDFSDIVFSRCESPRSDLLSNRIAFDHAEFRGNTDFGRAIFNYPVSFKGCRFSGDVYFGPSRTDTGAKSRNTVFLREAYFNDVIFMGRAYFLVKFAAGADFSDIVVTGQLFLYLDIVKQLNFKNVVVGDNLNFSPHIDENLLLDRETVRKFKHVSIKQSNTISAMRYKAREMELYKRELQKDMKIYILHIFRQESHADIGFAEFIFKIGEWVLLTLNRLSNNYGMSWMRGICFTLICWILFFTLTVWAEVGFDNQIIWFLYSNRLEQSLDYFWLFNLTQGLPVDKPLTMQILFPFLIGKVFIGYGIYQTISAFRKHGKL